MSRLKDLTNKRFGRLLVVRRGDNIDGKAGWICLCDCGKEVHLRSWCIGTNNNSCGCLQAEERGKSTITHGMTKTPEYKSWVKMRERCTKPKDISYKNYGAKGITVCDRWLNSFENFLLDMGLKPKPNYSIDRKDSTQNYNPDNCKWSSRIEQNNNKSDTRVIVLNGVKFNLRTFCAHTGIAQSTIYRRMQRMGISFEDSVKYYVDNCTE